MATSRCTTIQCTFDGVPLVREYEELLGRLVDQASQDLRRYLIEHAYDRERARNELRVAWSQLPHPDRLGDAHYAILVLGAHDVEPLREALDKLRAVFREHDFPATIGIVP